MKWKKVIDEVNTLPCILLHNKVDLLKENKEKNVKKLKEFAIKNGFCEAFRISAKTGLNINKSIKYLINTIIQRMKSTKDPNNVKDNKTSVDDELEEEEEEEEEKEEVPNTQPGPKIPKVTLSINSEINELFAKTELLQEFLNTEENPIELQIYVYKNDEILFDSFSAKIGDLIRVESKVIKTEKAETKNTDSIDSDNEAIFIQEDPDNEKRYIINLGNIPPQEKVIFKSKFIHFTQYNKNKFEFEFFKNLPTFQKKGNKLNCRNTNLNGTINIKVNHPIENIEKFSKNLVIKNEKFLDKENKNYFINYKVKGLPKFNYDDKIEYIPSFKINFQLNINYPIIYTQESLANSKDKIYCIKYKNNTDLSSEKKYYQNYPGLFIFLLDQSYSMDGTPIKLASNCLKLFLQSLPEGSYFQIIGFGSYFKKYDEQPKEYNKNNIEETLQKIEELDATFGLADIYEPLNHIYNSYELYENINLPKNIVILIKGKVENKEKVYEIIEDNNKRFNIISIGIGNEVDEDFIKKMGTKGKGGYNFCKDLKSLNAVVIGELTKTIKPYIYKFELNCCLEDKNKNKNLNEKTIIRDNEILSFYYIISKEDSEKIKYIKMNVEYMDNDGNKMKKEFDIIPKELSKGEELTKLIIHNHLRQNKDLTEEEIIELSKKYQVLTKYTSFSTEIVLSDQISKEMKSQILNNNQKRIQAKQNKSNNNMRDLLRREIRLRLQKLQNESNDDDGDGDDSDESEDWSISDNLEYWEEDDFNPNTEPIKIFKGRGPTIPPPPPLVPISPLIPQPETQQIKIGNEKIEIKDLSTKEEIMKMVWLILKILLKAFGKKMSIPKLLKKNILKHIIL